MEMTIEKLNEERLKAWERIQKLEDGFAAVATQIAEACGKVEASIQKDINTLQKEINDVKQIADAKTPEDVETAKHAAIEAIKHKDDAEAALSRCQELMNDIKNESDSLKQIEGLSEEAIEGHKKVQVAVEEITALKTSIDGMAQALQDSLTRAQKNESEATCEWKSVSSHVQEAKEFSSNAASAAASAKTSAADSEEIGKKLRELFDSSSNEIEALKQHVKEIEAEHTKELNAIKEEKSRQLESLQSSYETSFKELTDRIDSLLPLATAKGLAHSFADRKNEVGRSKNFWKWSVYITAGCLFGYGIASLFVGQNIIASLPSRMIALAGLLVAEEFSRRNYNIVTRLTEAYAYKEALAMSYVGFKKEMIEIDRPENGEDIKNSPVAVLASIFLRTLGDEPGKNVFDKEKQFVGPATLADQLDPQEKDSLSSRALDLVKGWNFLSKISWPVVAVITVLAIAICATMYLVLTHINVVAR